MRAAVLRAGRMVERDDVTEPVPGPGQVLVGVKACGICGSDLHFAKHGAEVLELNNQIDGFGGYGGMQIDLGRDVFMGHEFSAEVLEAGPGTETLSPGTLGTSLPLLFSATRFEPIFYSQKKICGYAAGGLFSGPPPSPLP